MTVEVVPTLALMAGVYELPATGGAASRRFRAYTDAAAAGRPVHGYNPMTTTPVAATIEALLAIGAERLLADAGSATAAALGHTPVVTMHFTVAAPGMWTDRLATDVEHHLLGRDPTAVLWWYDHPVTPDAVRAAVVAQTARLVSTHRHGPPSTVSAAVAQEGVAALLAGTSGHYHHHAAEILEIVSTDPALSTMVAFLYGDTAAEVMGFTPLGLADGIGREHATAIADVDTIRTGPPVESPPTLGTP